MASEYWELLRDPRWQRMRLEVMQRADFACEQCYSDEKTLNVHHTYYEKGKKPWEYPAESLKCLCESCHKSWHETNAMLKQMSGQLHECDIIRVMGYIEGFTNRYSGRKIEIPTDDLLSGPMLECYTQGLADAFGIEPHDIAKLTDSDNKVSVSEMLDLYYQRLKASGAMETA